VVATPASVVEETMSDRIIIIGDVHGCLESLEQLLDEVEFSPGSDELGFLGDLVDRGPESVEVVRRVRELGAWCVKGNHDDKHVRFRRRGRAIMSPDRRALNAEFSETAISWMESLPLYREFHPGWLAVHAGFEPQSVWLQTHSPVLMHIREWEEDWDQDYHVVYGHNVRSLVAPYARQVRGHWTLGIDTGCCFGGKLTAFVFDPKTERFSFCSVDALHAYAQWRPSVGDGS
jgi:bis(5'-nucleosyl)-tetraphosphatase (symmetrical)